MHYHDGLDFILYVKGGYLSKGKGDVDGYSFSQHLKLTLLCVQGT